MIVRCLVRVAAAFAVVASLVVTSVSPAAACTCVGGGPTEMLETADGVFVGTITDVGIRDSEGRIRFAVERWLVGNVHSAGIDLAPSGCGPDGPIGRRVAVGIWLDPAGRPTSSDCSVFDAAGFLDAIGETEPLAISTSPARYVARSGRGALWAFDAEGIPVGALTIERGYGLTPCGSGRVATSSNTSVEIIDLARAEVVVRHPRSVNRDTVRCGGDTVADLERTAGGRRLIDRTTGTTLRTLEPGEQVQLAVGDDAVFAAVGTDGRWELERIDIASGTTRSVALPFESDHRIRALVASPDRTRIAVGASSAGDRRRNQVAVIDASSGAVVASEVFDGTIGTIRWGDDDRLLIEEQSDPVLVVLADDLSPTGPLEIGRDFTVLSGDHALGLDGWPIRSVVRRPLATQTSSVRLRLPVGLDELVDIGAAIEFDGPGVLPTAPPDLPFPGIGTADIDEDYLIAAASSGALDELALPPVASGQSSGGGPRWLVAAAGGVAIAAAAGWSLRRRRRITPPAE